MSNTLSPISAAALIHDQHGVDFPCPLPCNDCSCETIWAWIDPCLMTCATILAVIAIATAFFQAAFQTAFLLFPVVAITCYFACQLCLTGEEGRLERAAENFEA